MLPKQLIKDYFTFTKKDRIFILLVVSIIGGSLIVPQFLASKPKPLALQQNSTLVLAMDTLQQRESRKPSFRKDEGGTTYQFERSVPGGFTEGELFHIRPEYESLPKTGKRMGLNARTTKTIINYVSKGGKFYKPEDLQKIWSLPEGFYERVKDMCGLQQ
jgi:hypothetical protein